MLVGVLDASVKRTEALTQFSKVAEGPPEGDDFPLSLLCCSGRVVQLSRVVPARNPAPQQLVLNLTK